MTGSDLAQHLRVENIAWGRLIVYLLLSMLITGNLATYLRHRHGWRDGYTRKLNHIGHGVWAALTIGFLPAGKLISTIAAATVAVAVIYGVSAVTTRPWFIRGIVQGSFRTRDIPHQRFFFFLPLLLGNVGIVAAFALFPPEAARAAIMVVAIGDGLAEPAGIRFGKSTTYLVRDRLFCTMNTKSLPGSATVAAAALLVAFIALPDGELWQIALGCLGFGLLMSAIEAMSPRGFDNLLLTVVGAVYMTGVLAWVG